MYKDKNILVMGLGRSGVAVAKLLNENNNITIIDKNDSNKDLINELENMGIKFLLEKEIDEISNYDIVVRSPGILPSHEIIKRALENNILIVNEVEVSYHFLPQNVKIIGVTGSNGKTTTTTIIYNLLSKIYDNVHLGGNIGIPLSALVSNVKKGDILVLEISDHQLYDMKDFKTNISVLTNLCETHLDFHGDYETYKEVKKKIFNNHSIDDIAIINSNCEDSLELIDNINSKIKYFGKDDCYIKDNYIYLNNQKIIGIDDILLKGKHNYENIMAALLVMNEFELDNYVIKEVLENFSGVEHRLELVKKIDNIEIYNDSKATNPTSTIIAINSFKKPIHLILGGFERRQDFNELNESLEYVKCIYAIGETSDRIEQWCIQHNLECYNMKMLELALSKIKENVKEGEVILLSPASASWDQYDKFETRGEEFKNIVAKMFD